MRIGAQTIARNFLPVVVELLLTQAALKISAGIDSRGRVRLVEHQIATELLGTRAKKMIETGLENLSRRSITRDVTAKPPIGFVGADYHREGVPSQNSGQPGFNFQVTRIGALLF